MLSATAIAVASAFDRYSLLQLFKLLVGVNI